ncbi:hypothetical protein [Plesiomonas shigelloides]|uniref:hypothetical protein n=1 Tax=Plesiomonas shigelloides TaxID=703 RepID=UPI00057B6100|nr:hypothetical protein [Plesiomonas shigelloides]
MFDIDSFAFNKILIFIVDGKGSFINMNAELSGILKSYYIDEYIGLTLSHLEERLPYYMNELFSNAAGCVPSESIDFDNGCLSLFSYDFVIGGLVYKYTMAMFVQKNIAKADINNDLIVDDFSGLCTNRCLEAIPHMDGYILLIKVKGLVCSGEKESMLIRSFSELIRDCFLDDVVCEVNRDTFAIYRRMKRNNFHKSVLTLKKRTLSLFGNVCPELWFSYVFEPVSFGGVYKATLKAEARLLKVNNDA